ncbi:MAG TPA: rod shape-determining protein MreD [Candidatus Dormibacteraeota bacterium]|nr:rod shape-determining protein MreD [Candidatus Dormibacteraeota bacterium]
MKYLAAAAVLFPAAILQVTLAPRLEVAGAFPNLVLLAVVGWTLVRGAASGLRWAIAGGLLLDLVAPGPLGVHALALAVAAYGVGFLQRSFEPDPWLLPGASGALAAVAYNLVLVALSDLLGHPISILPVLQAWIAPAALYQAALTPLALLVLRRLDRALPRPVVIDW